MLIYKTVIHIVVTVMNTCKKNNNVYHVKLLCSIAENGQIIIDRHYLYFLVYLHKKNGAVIISKQQTLLSIYSYIQLHT